MNMTTNGEVQWGEDNFAGSNQKKQNYKDVFLRLEPGDNEVRFITNPHQYVSHKYKPEGSKGYGSKVLCGTPGPDKKCPLCELGDKAKTRWYVGVIDRKTNTARVLDLSWSIYSQLTKKAKNPKIGPPTNYDINIVVDPNGGAGYYDAQNYAREPLSAADQTLRDKFDVDDLKRRVTSPTYEEVVARMKTIEKFNKPEAAAGAAGATDATKSTAVAKTTAAESLASEEDDEFPTF